MYKKTTFPNGLRTILVPEINTSTVTVLVLVGTGSKYENKGNSGVSHFLEHLILQQIFSIHLSHLDIHQHVLSQIQTDQ